ncbi:MAG: hypothetical protein M1820_004919 [Bogoriella megaspora]|nr:MAG: hypothetical protein M1820_004919 [Bogoriella megaspora]
MADAMNVPHCLSIGLAGSVVATMCDPSVEGMASPTETFTAPLFTTITNIMTTTWPDSDASTIPETSTSLIGYLSVAAPMFRLYWKASDRPRTSSPEEHPTITAGPTTNRSSTISSPTSVSEPLPILNGGLTTGTKTAIGVVVPLVVIGTAAAISALLFRRRKRAYQERTWIDYDKPELDASNAKKSTLNGELIAELPTESRVEARAIDREGLGNDNPHELPVPSLMHELSDS